MFDIRVLPDEGEPFEVSALSRDVVRWEAMDKRNNLSRLEDELRMSDLYGLTYAACLRQKRLPASVTSLQDFIDTHDLDLLSKDKPGEGGDVAGEAAGPTTAPAP